MTAKDPEVRAMETLQLRVVFPVMWKPRLWAASRLMLLAARVCGMGCTVEVASK